MHIGHQVVALLVDGMGDSCSNVGRERMIVGAYVWGPGGKGCLAEGKVGDERR